jgi:hypothetical protein
LLASNGIPVFVMAGQSVLERISDINAAASHICLSIFLLIQSVSTGICLAWEENHVTSKLDIWKLDWITIYN